MKTSDGDSPFYVTKTSVMSLIRRQKEGNGVKRGRRMKSLVESFIMLIWLPFARKRGQIKKSSQFLEVLTLRH